MIPTNLRKIENLHISIWLFKDLCWVRHFKIIGTIMIVPTLLIALWLTYKMRKDLNELAHNIGVCCWITANSIWMIGEFYYDDTTRNYATIFFALGISSIIVQYLVLLKNYFLSKKEFS